MITLKLLAVGFGGFFGSILRYLLAINIDSSKFPLATLYANFLACILAGLALSYFAKTNNVYLQLFIVSGFLGGLSTYSTFAYESYFILNKSFLIFALNIALTVSGSIFLFFLSYKFFSFLFK